MNAAIRAVVRQGIAEGFRMLGYRRGFSGLLDERPMRLGLASVADVIKSGGTFLRTARCPEFFEPAAQLRACENLARHRVDGLVVIGGEGSLRGAEALSRQGMPVVGVPASIDNDIFGTERSIGFDTAVNAVTEAMDRIRDTASAHERTFVLEVMGRESGAIALTAGLAGGAEAILVPELTLDYDAVVRRLKRSRARGKRHSLIVVAEGAAAGPDVRDIIAERTGFDVRLTILGHIQRGGAPSAADRILGSQLGAAAVLGLSQGRTGDLVGVEGDAVRWVSLAKSVQTKKAPNLELERLAAVLAI